MAISQRDKELWKAAQKSLADFGQIFDPNNNNPAKTNTEFQRYKSIKNLSDLDSITTSSGGGFTLNPVEMVSNKMAPYAQQIIGAGETSGYFQDETKLSEKTKEFVQSIGLITQPFKLAEKLAGEIFEQVIFYYKQQAELLRVINKEAGLTGEFAEDVRKELTAAGPELLRFGVSFSDLANSSKALVDNSGRFLALNRITWKETATAAVAYVGTLENLVAMFPEFEKVGIGAGDVAKQIDVIGARSVGLGLQSKKTIAELNTNLNRLNEYGFKNGVQGLAEMSRRSAELRMNMSTIFTIAEKVFQPEGAIELAANLQAIGGAIGDFNDPLKLMYMATNNVEGLGEALEGVAGSLATYNQEQNRFEITGVNLRRARALATELGISYTELANTAIASAERSSAAADLMSRGLDLDEDQKRFITNIATMKDGKMQIELQSDKLKSALAEGRESIALEELTQTQVDELMKYQNELKKLDKEQIIQKQATDVENIGRNLQFLVAVARERAVREGKGLVSRVVEMIGFDPAETYKKLNDGINNTIVNFGNQIKSTESLKESMRSDNKVKPQTNLDMSKMREPVQEQPTPVTSTINHNHTYTIKSDSTVVDGVTRAIINSPSLSNDLIGVVNPSKRDYISSPTIMDV
jgi:hypothetical protein